MLPGPMPGSWALSAHNDAKYFQAGLCLPLLALDWVVISQSAQSYLVNSVNNFFDYLQILKPGFEFCLCHIGTGGSWEEPHFRSFLVSLCPPAHNDVSVLGLLQNSPTSQREKRELDGVRASTVLGVSFTYVTHLLCSRPKPGMGNINIRAQSLWAPFQTLDFLCLIGDCSFLFFPSFIIMPFFFLTPSKP